MNTPKNANFFMFLLLIFLVFVVNIIMVVVLKIFPTLIEAKNIWIFQSMASFFSFLLPMFLYMWVKKIKFKDVIPLKPLSLKNFLIIIFMSFTFQPILQLIGNITNIFFKDKISDIIYVFASLSYPKALFVTAIVPAITEELAFRGVILSGYKKTSVLVGCLMSSLYFGIMHLTLTQVFYTIAAGVLFAYVVKITKSIYASIIMHFMLNGTQITIAHILTKILPEQTQSFQDTKVGIGELVSSTIPVIVTLPLLVFSVYLFVKENKTEIENLKNEHNLIKNSNDKPKVLTLFFYINIAIFLGYILLKK